MRTRPLGATGLDISELTLGTHGLSKHGVDAALLALNLGVNTIELGGGSEGEAALASVLASHQVHILSRVPSLVRFDLPSPHVPAFEAYPGSHIRAVTEASLKLLGVEQLACQMIHAWCPEWFGEGDWLETLVELRDEGKIAALGVSLFDHDLHSGAEIVASGAIDCIELMYNIFDPGAAAGLFRLCEQHRVGVIARSPLHFGALAPAIHGQQSFADWRADYFVDEHLEEARQRVRSLEYEFPNLPETALRFALSHPAAAAVAVGMTTAEQVEANIAAAEKGPLSAEVLERLSRHRWLC